MIYHWHLQVRQGNSPWMSVCTGKPTFSSKEKAEAYGWDYVITQGPDIEYKAVPCEDPTCNGFPIRGY